MLYTNLDMCEAFKKLRSCAPVPLKKILTDEAIASKNIDAGGGVMFNYAARGLDDEGIDLLAELAEEQELIGKYRELLGGAVMNPTENRRVLHHLTRGQQLKDGVEAEGVDKRAFYAEQQSRIADFSRRVHDGSIKGSTGKRFDTVVQIGIGGSDLGPRALCLALKNSCVPRMRVGFVSNVDPDDANAEFAGLDPQTTLFIVVSKSGTTQETLTNLNLVKSWMGVNGGSFIKPGRHIVAVTSETSPMANNSDYLDSFYIDDYIGGRYSSTSSVGGAVLSLAFGPDLFAELLQGAREADEAALNPDIRSNAALLDAMLGIYDRNVRGLPCSAVLPYSQALSRFPAHLQQLDMESNGKRVNRAGNAISYETGPVIFGEPGTNGQHSFYQLLHQGTSVVPLQFIGFGAPQMPGDIEYEGYSSHEKLQANLIAQIVAFALGQPNDDGAKEFPGGRPSSLLYAKQLQPRSLGALLAHYENKVMFQGFAWNINSFDQEGVQLGKKLANALLKGEGPAQLAAYRKLFV